MAFVFGLFAAAAMASAPQYPGGEEALNAYISENLKYPAMPAEMGIDGVVNLKFTVKADGSIGTISVVRMIDPDLEQEAIRLVKNMPAWIPAEQNGVAVDQQVELPIRFTLPD